MRGKTQELLLTLSRQSPAEHWGFSLVGGADVKTPLIVTRVSFLVLFFIFKQQSCKIMKS